MQGGSTSPLLEPLVYFDVRKQGTVNSDESNRDTLVDYSGKDNNGTLNYFTFSDYYLDDKFPLDNYPSAGIVTSNHILTIGYDCTQEPYGFFITASSVDTESSSIWVPSFKIKVNGLTSGSLVVGFIYNSFRRQLNITQDGTYIVPGYYITENSATNRRAVAFYSYPQDGVGVNSGVTVEFLPYTYDGYFQESIDSHLRFPNSFTYGVFDSNSHIFTVTSENLQNNPLFYSLAVTGLSSGQIYQFPSYKVKVQGIGTGVIRIGYYNQIYTTLITISSDGTYTVPGYSADKVEEYNPIPFYIRINSPVPVGCTIEFLPQTEYIQFSPPLVEGPIEYITLPSNNTQGYKTVFALVEIPENFEQEQIYYQNSGSSGLCRIDIFPSQVVSGENPDGDCFINGKLNTQVGGSSLGGKIILITCRNQNNLNMASPRGEIGYTGGWANHFKLYKFLGFSECLTDSQINQIIEDYGLMELVDYINVQ